MRSRRSRRTWAPQTSESLKKVLVHQVEQVETVEAVEIGAPLHPCSSIHLSWSTVVQAVPVTTSTVAPTVFPTTVPIATAQIATATVLKTFQFCNRVCYPQSSTSGLSTKASALVKSPQAKLSSSMLPSCIWWRSAHARHGRVGASRDRRSPCRGGYRARNAWGRNAWKEEKDREKANRVAQQVRHAAVLTAELAAQSEKKIAVVCGHPLGLRDEPAEHITVPDMGGPVAHTPRQK